MIIRFITILTVDGLAQLAVIHLSRWGIIGKTRPTKIYKPDDFVLQMRI
jgi:hypothetical protein